MKRRRTGLIVGVTLLTLTLASNSFAFLGFGDVVFDPSNYAQAIEQIARMEQQYAQLVQTYALLSSQYEHVKMMAQQVPVNMAVRYRRLVTPWEPSLASDTYATNGGWMVGANTGAGVAEGYARSVEALATYGAAALQSVPASEAGRLRSAYGTVELADGANVGALTTIGRLRGIASAVESTIDRLEADSLSAAPGMNTEIALLNKINAANLISVHAAQDTNKLLVALTEQQVLTAKRVRDAEARAINQHIRFGQEGRAVLIAQAAGSSEAMRSWRMP